MKWTYNYIQSKCQGGFHFSDEIIYDAKLIASTSNLLDLKDIKVEGDIKFISEILQCQICVSVKGTMIVPCSLTLEPVEYHFADSDEYCFTFDRKQESENLIWAKGDIIDLVPLVWQLIVVNIPLRVVKDGKITKGVKGKDWEVISEDDLEKKEEKIDPRLESLKNYFDKRK